MSKLAWMQAALAALLITLVPSALAAEAPQQTSEQVVQLDINSADAATIAAALEGVGMVKAREIVSYRETFGNFRTVDELLEVQGIGAATVERNRHLIFIDGN